MKRRDFVASMAVAPMLVSANSSSTSTAVTKVPICVDFVEEWHKEQTIPGYVSKRVAWANINLETGEWSPCDDDDPIYQHPLAEIWNDNW